MLTALSGLMSKPVTGAQAERFEMNFMDPDLVRKLWVVNDGVMGGLSQSRPRDDPEGVIFEGLVSLENNGGFASLRGPVTLPSGTSVLALTARGDGKRYKMLLRTESAARAPTYQCDFEAGDWHTHEFFPENFEARFRGREVEAPPLALGQVTEFGILIADMQAGPFKIQLKSLGSR